jgi:hypothetical protein
MRAAPKKELKTDEEARSCDICGRTILKGERTEPYLAPGGRRKTVCELCKPRADPEGWIRESAHGDIPATRARPAQRGSFVGRLRGMFESDDGAEPAEPVEEAPPVFDHEPPPPRDREPVRERRQARRDNRHIRAIPTTAQVKVERALEMFNESDHPRTIAGIARSLGTPWVHASPDHVAPSEVTIVVAWELSWYRYRVDLGDGDEPILLVEKGDELTELDEALRAWNAVADDGGRLGADVV